MERLTEWIQEEHRAIPRMDLRSNGYEKCTTRLAEYEDIELTPEQVQELAERDTAKRLNEICGAFGEKYECPNCGSSLMDIDALAGHCKWCGQRVEV